ncbi:hypothetical protein [Glaciimonas soli]|uniref:Uncharacterized protein n=1 Tax=Glaciimonas soli TaxID=2590999 RepID=A0A843YU38_9BURK|nr:hypothetical protein [Glaciimonas soli]MQR01517.1 hypothetical protein [Glaciimonas soli]
MQLKPLSTSDCQRNGIGKIIDRSVEQLPRCLVYIYGKAVLIMALESKLENEPDEKVKHGHKTTRWRIGD